MVKHLLLGSARRPRGTEAAALFNSARSSGLEMCIINLSHYKNLLKLDQFSPNRAKNDPQNVKYHRPITDQGFFEGAGILDHAPQSESDRQGAYVEFDTRAQQTVEVRVATSFVSVEQARRSLEQEIGARSFEEIRVETRAHRLIVTMLAAIYIIIDRTSRFTSS